MTTKNEIKLLLTSLVFTAVVLSAGFVLLGGNLFKKSNISIGAQVLDDTNINDNKQAGVEAFARGDYATAIDKFQASLNATPNDPETLIYLNNAKVANSNPLKVAVSVPIGSNINTAKEILRGVAQAQRETNNAGLIKLQLAIANDNNDPIAAQEIAKQLVQDKSILAVVGHNASNASISAAPVYQANKLVMVSPTSFSQNLSGIGRYIFRTVPNVRSTVSTLSNYIVKKAGKKNIALCYDSQSIDNQSFRDELDAAIKADGGKINSIPCDVSAANFNANQFISSAVNSGADAIFIAPYIETINKGLAVTTANKGKLVLFSNPTMYNYQTLQGGQADVQGMVLAVPWHPTAIPGHPFASNAKKLWGGEVNWRTALAYDALAAIARGLQQTKNRQELQQVLHDPNFSVYGATGNVKFLPSGDRDGKLILVQIQPNPQAPTGYDFVLLKQ